MPKHTHRIWPYLLVLLALLAPAASAMETGLDVSSLLRRPGVKLLAVEFYADWCKPCMDAVPKWKALHEKYRAKGLHLVVVSVGEQGLCSSPGWNPDLTVCDLDASLQKRLSANPLPQAFLWNWQGQLIAAHAPVEQVEAAIERYFAETPRILIADPKDENGALAKGSAALKEQVRAELRKLAKFDLVASASEQATLKTLRQQSHAAAYDEAQACALGSQISANSELKVTLMTLAPGRRKLLLQLFSVEEGCLKAVADAPIAANETEAAVFTAVSALVEQLVGKTTGEVQPAPLSAPAQAPAATGCVKDTDCKGERVCAKGECVEPAAKKEGVLSFAPFTKTNPVGLVWVYSPPAKLDFAKTETTVDQYKACVQAGKCEKPKDTSDNKYHNWGAAERGNHPVNGVDWNQARSFCEWAGGRLPTEEEWFSEASNGKTRRYPWGDQEASCDFAVMRGNGADGCGMDSTWPVCSKYAGNSVSSLCDMSGNVWEWTSSQEGKKGWKWTSFGKRKEGGDERVLRGGGWFQEKDGVADLLTTKRISISPNVRFFNIGFRCVRAPR